MIRPNMLSKVSDATLLGWLVCYHDRGGARRITWKAIREANARGLDWRAYRAMLPGLTTLTACFLRGKHGRPEKPLSV